MDPLYLETVIAVIGLRPLLEGRPRWGVGVAEAVAAYPRQVRKAIGSFLSRPEPGDVEKLPVFDYEEVVELLDTVGERQVLALHAVMDDPILETAVGLGVTELVANLKQVLPRRVRHRVTGDTPERPSDGECARFARFWNVACDPMIVFRDLQEHSLCSYQVIALREMYPEILNAARAAALDLITTIKARRKGWDLDMTREKLLRTLMGAPSVDMELAADMQRLYGAAQPAPGQDAAPNAAIQKLDLNEGDSLGTPGQKAG